MKNLDLLTREIAISKLVSPFIGDCIVSYDDELIDTDKGPGLVCDLVRNADGSVAPALYIYQESGGNISEIEPGLREALSRLIKYNIYFNDLIRGICVVKTTAAGDKRVVFIDLKGLHINGYSGFLKMERYIAPLARIIMFRRMRRLYGQLGIEKFPLDELCRDMMFSSFWVDVKL